MCNLIVLSAAVLCSSCALQPTEVVTANPPEVQAVVFDIDGTLTPDVLSISSVRPDAASAAKLFVDKGYKIFYLSARARLFQGFIPGWLERNDFPDGELHVPGPGNAKKETAKFKTEKLCEFIEKGWRVQFAYGDSDTDYQAYAAIEVPSEHIFGLKRSGAAECEPGEWEGCLDGWTSHMDFIASSVPPALQAGTGPAGQVEACVRTHGG